MPNNELDHLVEQLKGDYVLRIQVVGGREYTLLDPTIGEHWVSGFIADALSRSSLRKVGDTYGPDDVEGKVKTYFAISNILWMRSTESKKKL